MKTLHDRIGKVINTQSFQQTLRAGGVEMIEFQCSWNHESGGDFDKLPELYRNAILAGEEEFYMVGEITFA